MKRLREALNQLARLECPSETTRNLLESFSSEFFQAVEADLSSAPASNTDVNAAIFLDFLKETISDGEQLKPKLSRDDVKRLISGLVEQSTCKVEPCLTGSVAAKGIDSLLEELLPTF